MSQCGGCVGTGVYATQHVEQYGALMCFVLIAAIATSYASVSH
jgi:hypothetical protein